MNITGIARENFEEAGLPLKNTIELTTKNEYTIPDIWGLKVGRKFLDTGEIESHFEEQQFFEIRKRATLLEYPHTVILMEQDFADRVQDYQRIYNVGIRQTEAPGLYKYYSTQRPVDIGTFPKPPYNKPDEIFNYDQRIPVENGSFLAWGYLTYTRPLTEKQASDYELRPAPDNPDRPRPIAEQMKNAAKLAEADRGSEAPAPQRRQPDRGDR